MKVFSASVVLGLALAWGCTITTSDSEGGAGGPNAGANGETAGAGADAGTSGETAAAGAPNAGTSGETAGTSGEIAGTSGEIAGTSGETAGAGGPNAGTSGETAGSAGALAVAGATGLAGSELQTALDIANEELAAGAQEVVLDDETVLTRTEVDGQLTHWEVTVAGVPAMVVDYGADAATVSVDEDLDGAFDHTRTLTGTSAEDLASVHETAGKDGAYPTRVTVTRSSLDEVHLLQEVGTADGEWETVEETDAPKRQVYDATVTVDLGGSSCTPDQASMLQAAAKNVLSKGVECLRGRGLDGLAAGLQGLAAANGFNIVCKSMSELAFADVPQWEASALGEGQHDGAAQIEFNPTCVAASGSPAPCATNASTEGLLFHEMLHFLQGAHSIAFVLANILGDASEELEQDLVYSCQFACFDPNLLTKCSCATCSANYTPCSPECSTKAECKDPEAGYCNFHCPCNDTDYPSYGECNASCDVSLGCFTGICAAVP